MELKITCCVTLCALDEFEINGIKADADDFVEACDHAPEDADPHGCGYMRAEPLCASPKVLKKYGIDSDEFDGIANIVARKLSFGKCDWCS